MKLKIILSVLLLFSLLKVDANPLVDISIASGKEEADDLQQIKDSGELVVLTLYSSTSYFIYRGQDLSLIHI